MNRFEQVVIANDLLQTENFYTEFLNDYTMTDFALFFALLRRVNPRETMKPQRADIGDLCADVGFTGKNRRAVIKRRLKSLADKSSLYIYDSNTRKEYLRPLFIETASNDALNLSIDRDEVNYCFSPWLARYFCSQVERFTIFPAYITNRIASPFSFKLYLFLHSVANLKKGFCSVPVNRLARMLIKDGTSETDRTTLHDFKRAVIRAIDEINAVADITVDKIEFKTTRGQRGKGQKLVKAEKSDIVFVFDSNATFDTSACFDDRGRPAKNHRARKREQTQCLKHDIALMIVSDENNIIPNIIKQRAARYNDQVLTDIASAVDQGYRAKQHHTGAGAYNMVYGSMRNIRPDALSELGDEFTKVKFILRRGI